MPYSKRDAPNCDWCPYKKNCFYDLLGTKESKKAWREIPKRRQVGAMFRGLDAASRITRTRHAHNRTCSDLFIASPL